ncbi:MAG: hypothetical protein LH630_05020 [Actinomycetia bacterium]|nr:hypothetical protein [Actinomycetes bacterium]
MVASHQVAQAVTSQRAVAEMLAEQDIASEAEAFLVSTAFTTEAESFMRMYESAGAGGADRLVASLVQDAGRAAESVAVTVRPNVGYARHLSPPSCSRCAVLAGRIYRYSQGFQRHPGCDCTMSAVADGDITQAVDPLEMLKAGQLTGLSKADARALADGADFGQVVNVRRLKAGLTESGRVLSRRGRPTPEAIYARTSSRDEAVAALAKAGYII